MTPQEQPDDFYSRAIDHGGDEFEFMDELIDAIEEGIQAQSRVCQQCNGTGLYDLEECEVCNGMGYKWWL